MAADTVNGPLEGRTVWGYVLDGDLFVAMEGERHARKRVAIAHDRGWDAKLAKRELSPVETVED